MTSRLNNGSRLPGKGTQSVRVTVGHSDEIILLVGRGLYLQISLHGMNRIVVEIPDVLEGAIPPCPSVKGASPRERASTTNADTIDKTSAPLERHPLTPRIR